MKPSVKKKKQKKILRAGGLSFDHEGNEEEEQVVAAVLRRPKLAKGNSVMNDSEQESEASNDMPSKRNFTPNAAVGFIPKAMTKSALSREAQLKDALKKEYTQLQEAVKATEFMIPFIFYDGKSVPGGKCRVKKGDFIWLFLEQARKVGAELALTGDKARKDWARISVDDLMFVKSDIIIPHVSGLIQKPVQRSSLILRTIDISLQHYEFHYFMVNRTVGYKGPLFPISSSPTEATPKHLLPNSTVTGPLAEMPVGLETAAERAARVAAMATIDESELEGHGDDPSLTKVVDRRWYERNKHVFPASSWEEFDPAKDYATAVRKDALGNAMFFAR